MDPDIYYTIWNVVYLGMMLPTIFGNGLIIISIIKFRKLRSYMHVLIANLAVSDLIVGAILIPVDFIADMYNLKTHKYFCLGIFAVFTVSLGSSCYNLLLISIERFIVIVYPFKAHQILTRKRISFLIALGWVLTVCNGLIPLYGWNTFSNSTSQCVVEQVWAKDYRTYSDWQMILAPLLNFGFYSVVVYIALKKSRQETNTLRGELTIHSRTRKDIYKLVTMVIVLGTFMICWLPYACMSFLVTFWDTPNNQFIKRCTLIPGMLNSAMNWVIYGYRTRDFRKAFMAILKCRRPFMKSTFSRVPTVPFN